jgi:hypothetical protein
MMELSHKPKADLNGLPASRLYKKELSQEGIVAAPAESG